MSNHPLDLWHRILESDLDAIYHVMGGFNRFLRAEDTMIVDEEPLRVPPHAHIMDIADAAILAGEFAQQAFDLERGTIPDVLSLENNLRHRFDMALDLHIFAELVANCRLESGRLVVRFA